jgi:DDE family transposase
MSHLGDLKHAGQAGSRSFEGMLLPFDGRFSTLGECIRSLSAFDHLKIGRARWWDTLLKQTFYGFRVHMRVCWPGVIIRLSVAPADAHEFSVLPELTQSTSGLLVGDRNYHSPKTNEELATMAIALLAPHSSKKLEPNPKRSTFLSRLRYPG